MMTTSVVSMLGVAPTAPAFYRMANDSGVAVVSGGVRAINITRGAGGGLAVPTSAEPGLPTSIWYQMIGVAAPDVTAGMLVVNAADEGPQAGASIPNGAVGWVTTGGLISASIVNSSASGTVLSGTPLVALTAGARLSANNVPVANSKVYGFLLEDSAAVAGGGTAIHRIFFSGIYSLGTISG